MNLFKKQNIVSFVMCLIFLVWMSFNVLFRMMDIDLFQHFANAHMLKEGSVPYRDYNVLTPPLLQFIAAPFLLIYDDVLTLKLLNIAAGCILAFVSYKTYNQINNTHKRFNLILALSLSSLISSQTLWGYNLMNVIYNSTAIYFLLKIIAAQSVKPKYVAFLSLNCVCSLLTKQSTGFFLTAGVGLCLIYLVLRYKESAKAVITKVLLFLLIYFSSITIILAWLMANSALDDFIDQVFLGLSSFDRSCSEDSITAIIVSSLIIGCLYLFVYKNRLPDKASVICIISLSSLSALYPHFNLWHTTILWYVGTLLILICPLAPSNKNNGINCVLSLVLSVTVFFNIMYFLICVAYFPTSKFYTSVPYMNGLFYSKRVEKCITTINTYIKSHPDNNYRVISPYAVMFDLPRENTFIKYYDMILKGNTGTVDPYEMIVNDCDMYYYIIRDDRNDFIQMDQRIYEYIIDSGEFEKICDVYECSDGHPFQIYAHQKSHLDNCQPLGTSMPSS